MSHHADLVSKLEDALLAKTDEYDQAAEDNDMLEATVFRQQQSIRELATQLENASNDRDRARKQTDELHEATEKVKFLSKELDAKELQSKEHISTISQLQSELKYSADELERWQLFSAENGDIDARLIAARDRVEAYAQMAYSAIKSWELYRNELTRKQIQMQKMESELNLLYKDKCRRDIVDVDLIDINKDITAKPIEPLIVSNEANEKGSCKTERNLPKSELSCMSQLTDDTEIKLTDLPETQHCALDISACRINLEDFAELHAKASQAANYCMLFKSSQSVLRDQESEIQVLKSAIEVMTARPVEGVASTELLALKWEFLLIDINEDMTPEPIGPLIDSNEANQKGSCKTARNLPESELSGMSQLTDDTEIKLTDLPETQHCALDISACRINLEDFAELHAKASQAANYCMLFKSSQSVLRDQESEIQVLKSAIEVMTARPVEGVSLKLLQKQVEELRNVWLHESTANSVLRGLIVKTQQEAMIAADEAQAREKLLRAELGEAIVLYEQRDTKIKDVRQHDSEIIQRVLEDLKAYEGELVELRTSSQCDGKSKPTTMRSSPLSEPDTRSKDRDVYLSRITDLEKAQEVLSSEVKEIADARDDALAHVKQLVDELAHERGIWKTERNLLESELSSMRQLQDETEKKVISLQETQHRHLSIMETEAEQRQVDAVSKLSRDHTKHSEALTREHNQSVLSLQHQIQKLEKKLETTMAAKKSLERRLAEKDQSTAEAMIEFERTFKTKESAWLYEKQGLEERIRKAKDAWAAERQVLIKEAEVSKGAADLASRRIDDTLRERDVAQRALTTHVETAAATLNAVIRAHETELAASHMERATLPLEQESTLQQLTISDAARKTERERAKLLAAKYKNLKTDHQWLRDDCRLILQELAYLRAYIVRLSQWRNDLGYQKLYLEMARINLIESHQTSLDLIQGMGVASPQVPRSLTPTRKFRRCARVVIVCMRMKLMAAHWASIVHKGDRPIAFNLYRLRDDCRLVYKTW
ncbi:hypothetical protein SeMB42_g03545 [Synchytrium endobioticum]|uniref:Pericentrin/AKAP-450 centrosomal targeting domain-containing protein n=1 Tax=Synchytrium endobioticum TaxID=286115 RepID=A0A507D5X1_9FUNG|nr:hypothetical protein SeMB42_g03545 [Synchytrium endobioticum]